MHGWPISTFVCCPFVHYIYVCLFICNQVPICLSHFCQSQGTINAVFSFFTGFTSLPTCPPLSLSLSSFPFLLPHKPVAANCTQSPTVIGLLVYNCFCPSCSCSHSRLLSLPLPSLSLSLALARSLSPTPSLLSLLLSLALSLPLPLSFSLSLVNQLFSQETANAYFTNTYFDSNRSFNCVNDIGLPSAALPLHGFDLDPPTFKEFSTALRKTRNSSPGPNGIPYLIWKRCPYLARLLYRIICKVWSLGEIPPSWQQAMVILLPKPDTLDDPSQFRPIALSNCDGKVFFTFA